MKSIKTNTSFVENVNIEELTKRLIDIKHMINTCESFLATAPSGSLRYQKKANHAEFYHRQTSSQTTGKYISKKNNKFINALAQKYYMEKVLLDLKREYNLLNNFIQNFHPENTFERYSSLDDAIKMHIVPLMLSDSDYSDLWSKEPVSPFETYETPIAFCTSKNEYVRSKSEVLIANALAANNIPYRYEQPIILKNGRIVHPDFCCLNLKTRKEVYWEHFGLMDNPEYASNAARKLTEYSESGYKLGKNLIMTFETQDAPLDTRLIERMIADYLK